jgi:purine-binding chemotaxis protein CheW
MTLGAPSQFLVVRVGPGEFALPINHVTEILWMVELTPVPEAPPWLLGMVTVRGDVVPVIDLRTRLGLPAEPVGLSTPLVMLTTPGRHLAVVPDDVREVLTVPPQDVLPPDPAAGPDPSFDGMIRLDGRLILTLAVERVARELPPAA